MGRSFENRKQSIFKTAAQKSRLYARYGKQIYVVARNGVPDPESNAALRNLIEKAKREQVPAHVIEKAIDKAKGSGGEDYQSVRYEGYGPGGVCVIVDCLTDNNTRTFSEVRTCFTKSGSRLGASGSVVHLFDHVSVFVFSGPAEDDVLEALLEADVQVDEISCEDNTVTVFGPPDAFNSIKTALQQAFSDIEFETADVTFVPQTTALISAEDRPMFDRLMSMLNDCDDVQDVYHNAVPDAESVE